MKRDNSVRLLSSVGASLALILPLLLTRAAPSRNEQSATGGPLSVRPPAHDAHDRADELPLPVGGTEVGPAASPEAALASRVRVDQAYGRVPLSFEANRGQTDDQVKFLSRGGGYTLFLTSTEAVFVLTKSARAKRDKFSLPMPDPRQPERVTRTVVRMTLVGANPAPRVERLEELPGKVNYFIGSDATKWRTNVPTYARVEYKEIYPGVNLVYYGNQRQLEYDFVVAPGADPGAIRLAFEGVEGLRLDEAGDLILHVAGGELRQRVPLVHQTINGTRREISGRYVLRGQDRVGFQVAAFDRTKPLVIDPVLTYSTYLGGSDLEQGFGIAVDASGSAYVTGRTVSTDFPTTPGAFDTTFNGVGGFNDIFVTKLSTAGSALVYSTYLGGTGDDQPSAIAVDAAGNAYVTGFTASLDFPTTPGAFQSALGGGIRSDAFVTKLDPTGSGLVYSTYLGGGGGEERSEDSGLGIAVDAAGNAYVTGFTASLDFPTTPGAFQLTFAGGPRDAFVTKLNPTGSGLLYSTYLGGSDQDEGRGIAVDAAGNAYVMGEVQLADVPAPDFPTTPGAFQPTFGGDIDAFVVKLNAAGSALVYSTYLGGSGQDSPSAMSAIAVDTAGNAYVTGVTESLDFPTTPGAFQSAFAGGSDAFVTKLNAAGSALGYSTYLGGSGLDGSFGIAVDTAGNAYVTGNTQSANFPTTPGAFDTTLDSAFVTKLDPTGSALVYSTVFGGPGGIAVDASGNAYVTGVANSADFPTTPGAFQTTFGGGLGDAFVAKISVNTASGTNVSASAGNGVTVSFTAVASSGETTAATSDTGPPPPAGFTLGTPPTYYDITTTATFVPPVNLCITYDPAQVGDPSVLRLLHFESGAWVDTTTSNDTINNVICGQVSSLSPFVIAQRSGVPLTSLGPANVWVGLKNSDDVGIRFDLRAEVYRNGTELVGSGEVASVPGGSSGFNNATQDTITLTPVGGVTFQSGDTVSITLYVRNACTGSGKNSGTARLWFNDSAANSRFDATIGSPATYFLRDAFALATAPGPGPKKTIDVAAGAKCSPYKTLGTWTTTIH